MALPSSEARREPSKPSALTARPPPWLYSTFPSSPGVGRQQLARGSGNLLSLVLILHFLSSPRKHPEPRQPCGREAVPGLRAEPPLPGPPLCSYHAGNPNIKELVLRQVLCFFGTCRWLTPQSHTSLSGLEKGSAGDTQPHGTAGGSPLRNRTPVAKPLQDTAAPSLPCIPTTAKHKCLLAAPGLTRG